MGSPQLTLACICLESGVFYGVALLRYRQRHLCAGAKDATRRALIELILEYAPAELADLALRPMAMMLGMACIRVPILGVLAGAAGADILFYSAAALAFRNGPYALDPRSMSTISTEQ